MLNAPLGSRYPSGLLVVQDGHETPEVSGGEAAARAATGVPSSSTWATWWTPPTSEQPPWAVRVPHRTRRPQHAPGLQEPRATVARA